MTTKKRILAIIGSPTRDTGYTFRSVQALEQQLRAREDVDFDYIFLTDRPFSACQGKLTCIRDGESSCPYHNEILTMQRSLEQADAVIFGSPVHCFNVSSLLKQMIDLFVFQMHRPSFFGKQAIVVATGAGAGQKGVLNYLQKTFTTWGFEVTGRLGTHAGFFEEDKYRKKLVRHADALVTKLLQAMERDAPKPPGIAQLIEFRVWRSVVVRTGADSPYDWNHWRDRGWLEGSYYFDVAVNPIANALAGLVEKMIGHAINNVSVGPVK